MWCNFQGTYIPIPATAARSRRRESPCCVDPTGINQSLGDGGYSEEAN